MLVNLMLPSEDGRIDSAYLRLAIPTRFGGNYSLHRLATCVARGLNSELAESRSPMVRAWRLTQRLRLQSSAARTDDLAGRGRAAVQTRGDGTALARGGREGPELVEEPRDDRLGRAAFGKAMFQTIV